IAVVASGFHNRRSFPSCGTPITSLWACPTIPRHKSGKHGSRRCTPDISPQTSYRLDNRNYTGGAKESDEQEVTLCHRKTTTKRRQRRERGQLRHARVHPECFHHALDVAPLGVVTQTASIQATQSEKK